MRSITKASNTRFVVLHSATSRMMDFIGQQMVQGDHICARSNERSASNGRLLSRWRSVMSDYPV